jgi:hypothetical protein
MINDVVTDLDAVQFLRSNAPDVLETLRAVLVTHRANTISLVLQHEAFLAHRVRYCVEIEQRPDL